MNVLIALACLGGSVATSEEPLPPVRTDLPSLRKHISPPPALSAVTWNAAPMGRVGLGPTDLRLVAFFRDVPPEVRDAVLTHPATTPLPTDELTASVLPAGPVSTAEATAWVADAFTNARWPRGTAWAVSGGILVELYSG